MNCLNFVKFKKTTNATTSIMYGLKSDNTGYYYPFIDFNKFDIETKIPNGFKPIKIDSKRVKTQFCDFSKTQLTSNNDEYKKIRQKFKNAKSYFILDNGSKPFIVYVNKCTASIYRKPTKKYYISTIDSNNDKKWQYIEHVKTIQFKDVFIGKSPKTQMTVFSGGVGRKYNGNSILLQISLHNYVYIGSEIYEFKTTDIITDYVSEVGNSGVPYPVAIGTDNIYFMIQNSFVSRDNFPTLTKKSRLMLNDYFYGSKSSEPINKKFVEKIKKKNIHKRII